MYAFSRDQNQNQTSAITSKWFRECTFLWVPSWIPGKWPFLTKNGDFTFEILREDKSSVFSCLFTDVMRFKQARARQWLQFGSEKFMFSHDKSRSPWKKLVCFAILPHVASEFLGSESKKINNMFFLLNWIYDTVKNPVYRYSLGYSDG